MWKVENDQARCQVKQFGTFVTGTVTRLEEYSLPAQCWVNIGDVNRRVNPVQHRHEALFRTTILLDNGSEIVYSGLPFKEDLVS